MGIEEGTTLECDLGDGFEKIGQAITHVDAFGALCSSTSLAHRPFCVSTCYIVALERAQHFAIIFTRWEPSLSNVV
jgi:hypothetical protein